MELRQPLTSKAARIVIKPLSFAWPCSSASRMRQHDLLWYSWGMSSFDYSAPAELFLSKPAKGSRTKYRRFATAAEALRYAVEDLRTPKAFGAWLEVGDKRFNSIEIQRLYEAEDYPLRKPERLRKSQ